MEQKGEKSADHQRFCKKGNVKFTITYDIFSYKAVYYVNGLYKGNGAKTKCEMKLSFITKHSILQQYNIIRQKASVVSLPNILCLYERSWYYIISYQAIFWVTSGKYCRNCILLVGKYNSNITKYPPTLLLNFLTPNPNTTYNGK